MIARAGTGLLLFLLLIVPLSAHAARVALVVGNGAYSHTGRLDNPVNDATLMARSLRDVGFEVVSVADGRREDILSAMSQFGRIAQGADVALFFYAGHGLEVAGRNWLLPIDAQIETSSDLPSAAIKVDDVLELMELSDARIRMVVLDACRNNPLPRSLTRSTTRGLAKIDASAAGTMVVFSAAPGEVALDGSGSNSPFSEALARHIGAPGLEVRQMVGRVRQDVMAATDGKQVPWVNEAIAGDFFIAGETRADPAPAAPTPSAPAPAGAPSADLSVELAFWNSVKDSRDRNLLELYLQKYPDGAFRDLAQLMIAGIENVGSSPRTTPPQPVAPAPKVAALPSLEQQAREFVLRFNASFSASREVALSAVQELYAPQVLFHGKDFSRDMILRDKEGLIARWPKRNYVAPDAEIQVRCDAPQSYCDVSSIVYWNVESRERGKVASGVSQTDFRIDFSTGFGQVVYEASRNLKQ